MNAYLKAAHRVRRQNRSRDKIVLFRLRDSGLLAMHPLWPGPLSEAECRRSQIVLVRMPLLSLNITLTLEKITSMREAGFFKNNGASVSH